MVCSKASRSGIHVPANWTPPRYAFNDRVVIVDDYYGWSTGTVKGLVYVEVYRQYGVDCIGGVGWHYSIAIDEGMPLMRFSPLMSVHQSCLLRYPASKSEE